MTDWLNEWRNELMGEEINNGTEKLYVKDTIAIEIWKIVRQDS